MSIGHYHALCQQYRGRAVEIRTQGGRCHRGIIENVNNDRVFIQPLGRNRNLGGFGYGFGYGGFGYGLALGAIVGLTLLPFFFW